MLLIQHLRDYQNCPYGTIVGLGDGNIGVSICCPNDHFNKKRGIQIAEGRAKKYGSEVPQIHSTRLQNRVIRVGGLAGWYCSNVEHQIYLAVKHMRDRIKKQTWTKMRRETKPEQMLGDNPGRYVFVPDDNAKKEAIAKLGPVPGPPDPPRPAQHREVG